MKISGDLYIEGPQHIKPGELHLQNLGSHILAGTTPGNRKSIKSKMDGNEDFVHIMSTPNGSLFALCDAHFGCKSGKMASLELQQLKNSVSSNPIKKMFQYHYLIDRNLKEAKLNQSISTNSATTLITGYLEDRNLWWVNSGDSSLFLFRAGELKLLNCRRSNLFVGEFPRVEKTLHESFQMPPSLLENPSRIIHAHLILSHICHLANQSQLTQKSLGLMLMKMEEHTGIVFKGDPVMLGKPWHEANTISYKTTPEWGQHKLASNDIILAVTDGVCDQNNPEHPQKLQQILSSNPLEKAGTAILENTLERGGKDNASFLMIRVKAAEEA